MFLFVSLTMLFILVVSQATDEAFGTPPFYGANHDEVFHEWAQFFNKSYSSSNEESARFKTFMSNWRMIDSVNSKNLSYTLGLNQFADMTAAQFRLHVHGKYGSCLRRGDKTVQQMEKERRSSSSSDSADSSSNDDQRANVPSSIDWTTKGVVTPVKNQGGCGSCWAFSATGSMESRYAIAHGKLVSLSEQQLVDCDRADGNEGCNGGFETYAMKYAAKEGGLCSEEEYPYTSGNGKSGKCKVSSCKTKFDRPTGATYVKVDSATALEDSVLVGPVSVAIDAAQNAFQFYQRGVLSGRCGKKIDHAVLLVGYGVDGGKKYWKVKNSWGKSWGEKGYVRICRECGKNGNEGECGILSGPSFPDY